MILPSQATPATTVMKPRPMTSGADCSCAGEAIVEGCTDETACTTMKLRILTMILAPSGDACDDGDETTTNDVPEPLAAGEAIVEGCTDETVRNYDAAANTDDGSCSFPTRRL